MPVFNEKGTDLSSPPLPANNQPVGLTADRIQYRIGHGGFHATIVKPDDPKLFKPLVYVYDVGAGPDVNLLENAVDRFVARLASERLNRIDFVILSHIDEDHVSRFDYLLENLRKAKISVGTMMLPWLGESGKMLALTRVSRRNQAAVAFNLLQSNSRIVQYAAGMGVEHVTFVRGETDGDDGGALPLDAPSAVSPSGTRVHATFIASGTDVVPRGTLPWTMIVTHLEVPRKVLTIFETTVTRVTGLDPTNQANHAALIGDPKHRRAIRRAMRGAAKGAGLPQSHATITNWSSLSLYSSSTAPFARHAVPPAPNDFEIQCEHGWLHTGDLPLDLKEVWRAFERAWTRNLGSVEVCVVTAPHHGSMNGHNVRLYKRFRPSTVVFNLGLWAGSKRGKPQFAKWINPKPAMREVRALNLMKVRVLNNRI